MNRAPFFIILLFISVSLKSDEFIFVGRIPAKPSFFTTDNLGNCYIIQNDLLEKFDNKGNLLKTYSNKSFGKISFVDVSNPLKLMLFYRDFLQIIFLDNMLAQNGIAISLDNMGFQQIHQVCSATNNGLWVYNQQNFELIRFDQNLQKTQQTGNISQLLSIELEPDFISEYNNFVYLNNPKTGILVFDIYGTYYKTIPIKCQSNFQIKDHSIFYFSDQKFKSYNMKTLEETSFSLPDSEVFSARSEKETLFLLKQNSLDIYSVK